MCRLPEHADLRLQFLKPIGVDPTEEEEGKGCHHYAGSNESLPVVSNILGPLRWIHGRRKMCERSNVV